MIKRVPIPVQLLHSELGISSFDDLLDAEVSEGALWLFLGDKDATEEEIEAARYSGAVGQYTHGHSRSIPISNEAG